MEDILECVKFCPAGYMMFDSTDCAPGCPAESIGDGWCHSACFVDECQLDLGDCADAPNGWCAPGCGPDMIGDNNCDPRCLT